MTAPSPSSSAPPPAPATPPPDSPAKSSTRDDIAYVGPFALFMLFTWIGSHKGWYPLSYILKTILCAIVIAFFWKTYTKISWKYSGLGIVIGALGLVQWIGTEKFILSLWPNYPRMGGEPMNPFHEFATPQAAWAFILFRWAGATLLVPVMEELFWRDYLQRQLIAPNDFKMAGIGEFDPKAFITVALIFGAGVHVQWFTAVLYGLLIGWLLIYTRSLGACIVCHATTNFLLGAYVIATHDWYFW